MSDDALTAAIRAVLAASPFHGEGHRKVWARLRHAAIRTSLRRVLRLMRENDLLAPPRVGSPRGPRNHDGTIIPETVDTMWGTDLTTTFTGEGPAAVFVAVDHCSAECVGVHAHSRATRFEALEPIRQGVRRYFGGFAKGIACGLAVRHDHGSQYMSDHFQKEIGFLGIESSPAFVRAPEGNGCAERFIRTLKENLLWVRHFETIEELRQALLAFREVYNTTWLIERHGFITPALPSEATSTRRQGGVGFNPVSQKLQAVQSFFATLECELLERRRFASQVEARMACFSFIEGFYNPTRRHSALGYRSPICYEQEMQTDRQPATP